MTAEETNPIRYWNRYAKRMEIEAVYGEAYLRWTYESLPGRITLETFVKRSFFSMFYGRLMNGRRSGRKISPFIEKYGLDPSEFEKKTSEFIHFNDFFSRRLKPESRPIAADPQCVVFPADGRHLGIQSVALADRFYAKNQSMNLEKLLGCRHLAERYTNGSLIISRLCPVDYHRFHYPADGVVSSPKRIPGWLYSVNPIALRRRLAYLFDNKRYLSELETEDFGRILMLEIGATCVGRVQYTGPDCGHVVKGGEKGTFLFGGSCVMTLFEPDRVRLSPDLDHYSRQGVELFARMGDVMATKMGSTR